MKKSFRSSLLLLLTVLLPACSPLVTSTPPPSPVPVRVAYSPTLRPITEWLHQCALENPDMALIPLETSSIALGSVAADITLWFGEPPGGIDGYALSLGEDQIVVVSASNASLVEASRRQLVDQYTRNELAAPVWTYGPENELRALFEAALLDGETPASELWLAPHPAAMLEALTADTQAVGYLPALWMDGTLTQITLEPDLQAALTYPILAITAAEPEGVLRGYLACLQDAGP